MLILSMLQLAGSQLAEWQLAKWQLAKTGPLPKTNLAKFLLNFIFQKC